jgi:site-specific DNA-cytosine methylase
MFTGLSLFTGLGGIERGVAGVVKSFSPVLYVERDSFAITNLVSKIRKKLLPWAPIYTELPVSLATALCRRISIVTAGPPCQPYSKAGNRRGTADERDCTSGLYYVVKGCMPDWVFIENVPEYAKTYYYRIREPLQELAYSFEEEIFTAAETGAPFERPRLFSLGRLADARKPRLESPQWSEAHAGEGQAPFQSASECRSVLPSVHPMERDTYIKGTFPALPGLHQEKWEAPRTIEPKLGRSVDGIPYRVELTDCKYRTDRIRLLGNSAVPTQVANAFINLMSKHERKEQ